MEVIREIEPTRPTLGVAMIVKDEVELVSRLVKELSPYVDQIYITITGPKNKWKTLSGEKIHFSHFKWTNDFSEARNFNLAQVKTDYLMWLDADDMVKGLENIPELMEQLRDAQVDAVYMPYHYQVTLEGETISFHYRERIVRNNGRFAWKGRIHENLMPEEGYRPRQTRIDNVSIWHIQTQEDVQESSRRNHQILIEEYNKEPRDPRITQYLAISFFNIKDYDRAIELFHEHIETSGRTATEHRFVSWQKIAEAYSLSHRYSQAIEAYTQLLTLYPHYPDGYLGLAETYYNLQDFQRSWEWLDNGLRKPRPKDLTVYDPGAYTYRPRFLAALLQTQLGDPVKAYEYAKEVKETAPFYDRIISYWSMFEYNYYEHQAIHHAKWLMSWEEENGGSPQHVLDSLGKVKYDERLLDYLHRYTEPKIWDKNSVVFYCGRGHEGWGPDKLERGIGGSEEAVIYLSRELSKLGYSVTVYNDREEPYTDVLPNVPAVTYLPHTEFNPKDAFNLFVAWRAPEFTDGIKAKKIYVDLHDVVEPERVKSRARQVDKFFVKSKWHRDLYKDVPDSKFAIIGNGIVKEQFKVIKNEKAKA